MAEHPSSYNPEQSTNPLPESNPELQINQESSDKAWLGSEAQTMLEARDLEGMGRLALITDIDNTFYRTWENQGANYTQEITDQSETSQCPIIFITGNDVNSIIRRIESGQLPPAQVIVGSAGTENAVLHIKDGKPTYAHDEQFDQLLASQDFPRRQLTEQASQLINQLSNQDQQLPEEQRRVFVFQQPEAEQSFLASEPNTAQPYKISFHFFANSEQDRQQFEQQAKLLFPNQKTLTCEEIGYNTRARNENPNTTRLKYCLDIVAMTKADAADYVIDQLNLEGGVFAGDSGNDDHVYRNLNPNFARVLVGGARVEGEQLINQMSTDRKTGLPIDTNQSNKVGFRTLLLPDEPDQNILGYKEPTKQDRGDQRLGPQSLLYALNVLTRWEASKRLNQTETDTNPAP